MPDPMTLGLIALKGFAILAVTAAIACAARHASAALRHVVWTAGLAASLIVPFIALAAPSLPVPGVIVAPSVPTDGGIAPAWSAVSRLANPLPGVWLAGSAVALCWILAGSVGTLLWARRTVPLASPAWLRTIAQLERERLIPRAIRFVETADCDAPCTWGSWRPTVLLPGHGEAWAEARRRNALVHEIAHIRRRDALTQLIARLACALYWFNPLVWIAARAARTAREQACDDVVILAGARPSDYACELIATASRPLPSLPPVLAMARPTQLSVRLFAVLASHTRRAPASRAATAAAVTAAMLVALPLGALTPQRPAQDATQAAIMRRAAATIGTRTNGGTFTVTYRDSSAKTGKVTTRTYTVALEPSSRGTR